MDAKQIIESSRDVWNTCEKLRRYLKFDDNFENYLKLKRTWIDRLASPEFPVVFLGVFNSGKSTVVNAILGRNLLSESSEECTAIPTILKKGGKDEAYVYFIDGAAKEELKQLYVDEICRELRRETKDVLGMANNRIADFLEGEIKAFNDSGLTFTRTVALDKLKKLIAKWDRANGQKIPSELNEVQKYVNERYEDIIIVDKVEIYLRDFDVPPNVVLVDLPGLAASNLRHQKITREYVEKTAKAFVFCMKPKHLLGTEEDAMLQEIKKQNPRALQTAFWLINQCDTLNTAQLEQEVTSFKEKCGVLGFKVSDTKFVKASALNYLLLKCIERGIDSSFVEKHLETLQKTIGNSTPKREECSAIIKNTEFVKGFEEFRKNLFEYLQKDCMTDFYEDTKKQFKDLIDRILKMMQPLYGDVEDKSEAAIYNEFVAGEIAQKADEYLKRLSGIFEKSIEEIRKKIVHGVFWNDRSKAYLRGKIKENIARADKNEIFCELIKGHGIILNYADLPATIRNVTKMDIVIQENFIALLKKEAESFLNPVLEKLAIDEENKKYLNDEIIEYLKDKIGERDVMMRLQGVLDTFFMEYQNVINSFHRQIFLSNEALKDQSEEAAYGSEPLDEMEESIKFLRMYHKHAAKAAAEMGYIKKDSDLEKLFVNPDKRILIGIVEKVTDELEKMPVEDESVIEKALKIWENHILDFAEEISERIDRYIQLCIKNHLEDLYENIMDRLNQPATKKEIARKFSMDLSVTSQVNENIRKINDIKDSYLVMKNIKSALER